MKIFRRSILSFAALALSHALAAANVLTVGPGQAFTNLQTAATAAQDGDVLLLKSATFVLPNFSGKGLSVLEDAGAVAKLFNNGTITIQNVPLGSTFTLSGVETTWVTVSNCQGAVRFQNCKFTGGLGVNSSPDVWISNCDLHGQALNMGFGSGAPALAANGSTIAVDHCLVVGTNGGDAGYLGGFPMFAGDGGDAMVVTNSTVFFGGCTLMGGDGGWGHTVPCGTASWPTYGGDAGDGLEVTDALSHVDILDTTAMAGFHGLGGFDPTMVCPSAPDGAPGMDVRAPAGTVSMFAGVARQLTTIGLAREANAIQFDVQGQPGDVVVLALADATAHLNVPGRGVLGVALPARRVTLGTIGAGGTLSASIPVPELGAGVLSRRYQSQLVCVDATSNAWFGTPVTLTLLDSSL